MNTLHFLFIWVRLNLDKTTEYIIPTHNFTHGGLILAAKSTVKYVGVKLDQHLSRKYIARKPIKIVTLKLKFRQYPATHQLQFIKLLDHFKLERFKSI